MVGLGWLPGYQAPGGDRDGAHLEAHGRYAIAYLALFVALSGSAYAAVKIGSAQVADNSLRSVDIRDRSVKGIDIGKRTLRAEHFRPGVLTGVTAATGLAGPQGPQGPQGAQGAQGPSFGDTRQVGNVNDIACDTDVVVGTLSLSVAQPSRIWVHGQGTMRKGGSSATTFGLSLRLRDSGDTTTLATSIMLFDSTTDGGSDGTFPLVSSGILLAGEDYTSAAPAFIAPSGAYVLQLVARAGEGSPCVAGALPDFGYNQGGAMGYLLVGTG